MGVEVTPSVLCGSHLRQCVVGCGTFRWDYWLNYFCGCVCGATNTPIACTLMGIELFGARAICLYLGIACVVVLSFSP